MVSPSPASAGTVSARVAAVLAESVADVFGVMGNGNAWFLDAVVTSTAMAYTPVRHEAAAVAAADAYYRASGRVAVATTTYGPGYTNAITPLTEAAQARIPVVLVTGDAPATVRGHDVDQGAIAAAAGAAYFRVSADDVDAVTAAAIEHARTARTAVVLGIPYDIADSAAPAALPMPPAPEPHRLPSPSAAEISEAASILSAASRPLILAGRGAWLAGAQDAAAALAERLGALTATSALAMGFFDAESALGVSGGFATGATAELVESADAVLVLGASLTVFTTRFGHAFAPGAHVIQVDVAEAPTNPRVTTFLRGDARAVAEAIIAALPPGPAEPWRPAELAERRARPDGDPLAPDGRLDPRSVLRRLDATLPADRVVVQDGGHFIGWAPTYLTIPAPDRLIMVGTAFQTIGLGLPSAVGAGRARPDSTIVLCSGDGGALMGLADLETVVRTVRRGVVLVFNDAAYGAEVHQYGVRGIDDRPMLIPEVDFAGVAAALGASSAVIRTLDDLGALEHWLAADAEGVFLADLRVSREVVAPYMHEVVAAATGWHTDS